MKTEGIRRGAITIHLAVAFGPKWSIAAAIMVAPDGFNEVFGASDSRATMFYPAGWAPNIAAQAVAFLTTGWLEINALVSRLFRWRVRPCVWIAAPGFYPVLMRVVERTRLGFRDPLSNFQNWHAFAAVIVTLRLVARGPLGEELGLRGFLLPRLLTLVQPLIAALALGTIWMGWHLPAFFESGVSQSKLSLPIFMLGSIALNCAHLMAVSECPAQQTDRAKGQGGALAGGAVLLVWLVGMREIGTSTKADGLESP